VKVQVYVSSQTKHAHLWHTVRRAWDTMPFEVISTWIDEAGPGETVDFADLWTRNIAEASRCDLLIAYVATGDVWKGVYIEIGAALAHGHPVYVIGDRDALPNPSWLHHPLVTLASDPDDAIADFISTHRPAPPKEDFQR
jgi:hypothetical protein